MVTGIKKTNMPEHVFAKMKGKDVVFAPHLSSMQICTKDQKILQCSSERRGAVADMGGKPTIFEICGDPDYDKKGIRETFKQILVEKLKNDLHLCNFLMKDKEFKEIFGELKEIDVDEILK